MLGMKKLTVYVDSRSMTTGVVKLKVVLVGGPPLAGAVCWKTCTGAWTGLGHILMSSDDKPHALEAYRRALKIYPQLSVVQTLVERLTPQVEGQDL